MGLDEVIAFLAKNGLEGVLTIAGGAAVTFRLYIHEGRILLPPPTTPSCNSDTGRLDREVIAEIRRRARLQGCATKRPNRRGRVGKSALASMAGRATQLQRRRPRGAAQVGKESGKLSRAQVEGILDRADQLESQGEDLLKAAEAVHGLFEWEEARFRFKPRSIPAGLLRGLEDMGVVLDSEALLLEVARRSDERRLAGRTRPAPPKRPRRPSSGRHAKRGPEQVVRGDLDGVGLGAVLEALRTHRRTGTLEVRAHHSVERLYFHRGRAYLLKTEDASEARFVRDFLGARGTNTVARLARDAGPPVSEEEQRDLEARFLDLLLLEGARFAFRQGELPLEFYLPEESTRKVALPTDRFLMRAIGRVCEWDQLKAVLGGNDAVLRFTRPAHQMVAVRDVADYLILLDGRRSFDDLVHAAGIDRLEAARAVAELIQDGRLARV